MAVTKNLNIDQGSSFTHSLTAFDGTGNALDISSGYTASAKMRRSHYAYGAVSFDTSLTGGTGGIQIALNASASATLKPGRYVWDAELQYPNGDVKRLQQGNVYIDLEATK